MADVYYDECLQCKSLVTHAYILLHPDTGAYAIKCYTTIHINEVISLVLVRALLEYRSRMTSHNNKTFFQTFHSHFLALRVCVL